jgi:hypothetical protein
MKMVFDVLIKWVKTPKAWVGIVGTAVLFVVLAWIFSAQAQAFPAKNPFNVNPSGGSPGGPDNAKLATETLTGNAPEGQAIPEEFSLEGKRIWSLRVTLTWTDEANSGRRFTNQADSFELAVTLPDGTSKSGTGSGTNTNPGNIAVDWNWTSSGGVNWADAKKGTTNDIAMTVTCTAAGDQQPRLDILHLRDKADPGNDYSLLVEYRYTD